MCEREREREKGAASRVGTCSGPSLLHENRPEKSKKKMNSSTPSLRITQRLHTVDGPTGPAMAFDVLSDGGDRFPSWLAKGQTRQPASAAVSYSSATLMGIYVLSPLYCSAAILHCLARFR